MLDTNELFSGISITKSPHLFQVGVLIMPRSDSDEYQILQCSSWIPLYSSFVFFFHFTATKA